MPYQTWDIDMPPTFMPPIVPMAIPCSRRYHMPGIDAAKPTAIAIAI